MRLPGGVIAACALAVLGCGDKDEGQGAAGNAARTEAEQAELAERTFELPHQHAYRDQTIRVTAPLPPWELEPSMSKESNQLYRGTKVVRTVGPWFMMGLGCHGSCQGDRLRANVGDYLKKETERFSQQARLEPGSEIEVDTIGGPDQPQYGFVMRHLDAEGALANVHVGVAHFLPDAYDHFVWCSAMLPGEHAPRWQTLLAGCQAMQVEVIDPLLTPEVLAAEQARLAGCPAETTVTLSPGSGGRALDPAVPATIETKDIYAYAQRPGRLDVVIANVALEASTFSSKQQALEQGQVGISLDIHAADGEPVASGVYPAATQAPRVDARIHVAGGRAFAVGTGEGGVTITARTFDRVCGTFDMEGTHHHLSGTFTAPLHWIPKRRPL